MPDPMQPLLRDDAGRLASRTARKPESKAVRAAEARAAGALAPGPIEDVATRAEVRRLYDHTGATTVAGIAVALSVWLLFEREGDLPGALGWAVAIHTAQLATLALLWAYRRDEHAPAATAAEWQRRFRIAVGVGAVVWGSAAFVFLPG